jgi:hypothetical protein
MIQPELKKFWMLQYKWIRLQHPSIQVSTDKHHPLHQTELEIAHSEHIINNLIQDVLSGKGVFSHDDVIRLITTFSSIRLQLDSLGNTHFVNEYKQYVDQTLELLNSALAVLK